MWLIEGVAHRGGIGVGLIEDVTHRGGIGVGVG